MIVNIQNKKGDSSNFIFPEAMKSLKLLFTGNFKARHKCSNMRLT